ncbi:hypothetical protein PSH54_02070 [Pseudoalteromonas sp. Angola-30]|uniref:hypothetical protein n=1 Tax=Pseudoalteromonas sp. Angola-30 TaxID=3025341 RepID=UPI002358B0AF|nr:hypothetical protein [Pseudoalteromonas sp. Angola-30]MDC9524290.1 hypothetical protein [Pseudoalteromonas sp. Angola-30]
MVEILKALNPLLLILLGSLISILGGIFQFRVSDNSRKITLLSSKLERAYELCQLIYDGHKREVSNAQIFLPYNSSIYIDKRCHPGVEMSELKMLIRAYIPELKKHLEKLDSGHKPLKKSFTKIDKAVIEGRFNSTPSLTLAQVDLDSNNWSNHLALLSKGSFELKKALEDRMSKLV